MVSNSPLLSWFWLMCYKWRRVWSAGFGYYHVGGDFLFTPTWGNDPILTHIFFQWVERWNHQPEKLPRLPSLFGWSIHCSKQLSKSKDHRGFGYTCYALFICLIFANNPECICKISLSQWPFFVSEITYSAGKHVLVYQLDLAYPLQDPPIINGQLKSLKR